MGIALNQIDETQRPKKFRPIVENYERSQDRGNRVCSTSQTSIALENPEMAEILQNSTSLPKKPISEYTRDEDVIPVMENAKRHDNKELWWECLRRRCELKRKSTSEKGSPLELGFYAVMLAYETLEAELRRRKNYRATRTWKMADNKGVKAVLEKWARNRQKGSAFKVLMDHEAYDLTGEYLVLKYKSDFSPEVVSAARQSLLDAGVPPEKLEPS